MTARVHSSEGCGRAAEPHNVGVGSLGLVAPLARGVTYRRAVHLLLGAVLLLPYLLLGFVFARVLADPGSPRPALPLILAVALVLGAAPAFLRGTRAMEIAPARLFLDVDLPDPVSGRPARLPLEARIRAAVWFELHLFAGGLVALVMLTAFPMALILILHRRSAAGSARLGSADGALAGFRLGPLDEGDAWWWSLIGVVLLIATAYAVAGLGTLAALVAPVLLGPSQAELMATLRAESQRLAEGNRIARELHDTIGAALTATTSRRRRPGSCSIPTRHSPAGLWRRSRGSGVTR